MSPSPRAMPIIWSTWWNILSLLRPAFTRFRTFLWFAFSVTAFSIRSDLRGVTSFVRALGLRQSQYDRLLDFFHSPAVDLPKLSSLWSSVVRSVLAHLLFRVNGRIVLLADGIKAPKSGRKMPAVKKLHQDSQNNSKPQFISGHSCQAIALVVSAASSFFALPLACRIHEGLIFSNRDKRTLLDKLVGLFNELGEMPAAYFVADAYYAAAKIIRPMLRHGHHLVSSARSNAVAFEPAPVPKNPRRGRPRKFGRKRQLKSFFANPAAFTQAPSPVYGESNVRISFFAIDLLWRPAGQLVRFVLVIHPNRGRKILFCTDTSLDPLEIIRLYGVRFKIEVTFKQAVHSVGVWAYHFWMAAMPARCPRSKGNEHLHRKPEAYRDQVKRKMRAYQCHIQVGLIAQGMLQCISLLHHAEVWKHFGSWIRTIREGILPSESITANALRESLPDFLRAGAKSNPLAKFILARLDLSRAEGWRLAS